MDYNVKASRKYWMQFTEKWNFVTYQTFAEDLRSTNIENDGNIL